MYLNWSIYLTQEAGQSLPKQPTAYPCPAFYKPIFPKLQQRNAPYLLATMRKSDPLKAKRPIIPKAYSSIRDAVGKQRTYITFGVSDTCLPKDRYLQGGRLPLEDGLGSRRHRSGTQVLSRPFFQTSLTLVPMSCTPT
jgi:hypothetical protein